MESKRSDHEIGLAIRCSKVAFMLSSIRSSRRTAPAADRDHPEMERMRRSEEDLKAVLARERSERHELVELGRMELGLLLNLAVLIPSLAVLLFWNWVE